MDQIKIGALLKELRKERNLTQESIADKFGVSQRSVSRWENGNTMPDISILIELSDFYDVDLREILKGERKETRMNEDLKETLALVSDYTAEEKKKIARSIIVKIGVTALAFVLLGIIVLFRLESNWWWHQTAELCLILGITYQIFNITELLQLTGKIRKKDEGKCIAITIIVFMALNILTMAVEYFI